MEDRVTTVKKTILLADGKEYEVKPLSLKATKNLLPTIKKLDELKAKEGVTEGLIDIMADICLEILQPTNSDLTKEKIYEIMELGTVYKLLFMAMGS